MAANIKLTNLQHVTQQRMQPAWPIAAVDRSVSHKAGWRSSCGIAPRRQDTRGSPKCHAVASPHNPPLWSLGSDCEDVMQRLRETEELRNCLGYPLTPEEQISLVKCLDSAQLSVDSCLVEGLPALHDHLLAYIAAVANTQSDDLELVEGAMLLIEQLSLAMQGMAEAPAGSVRRFGGQWQLLVTTGGGWPYGRLQYVPIIELLEISEDGQHFRLESKMGPLYTHATGNVTWQQQPNHLHYNVNDFRVELFGASLQMPAPAPDNDLMVFAATPTTALARSSLGGLSVMGRPA